MKKLFFILSAILTLSLLSGCGSSEDIAPPAEALTKQVSYENKSSTTQDEINTEQAEKDQEPSEEIETDKMFFYVIHSIRQSDCPVRYYFDLSESEEYAGFGTGILFLDDGYQSPYWLQKESPDSNISTPVHLEGELGESIQKSFEDMYTKDISAYDSFFGEKFNELAEEVVNSKCHNYDELYAKTGITDISENLPDGLSFETQGGEIIKLPISSVDVRNDRVDSVPIDCELAGPSWDDGEKRYGLSNMTVIFNIPKDSLDELRTYLFEQIKADEGDSSNEETASVDEKTESQSSPIPPGKNFNKVTGFEGYWYNVVTGKLDYDLFSDGTGLYVDEYDGSLYDIDYDVDYEYKMLSIGATWIYSTAKSLMKIP